MLNAYVVAHFHVSGLLGTSTRNLLEYLRRHDGRVILVSTGLTVDEALAVPAGVEVIVRENVGYDFYSYKIGIEAIVDPQNYDYVFILNNSFVCFEPQKLMDGVFKKLSAPTDILGLTCSRETSLHLQSFFIAFSRKVVLSAPFRNWWRAVEPISDRQSVIDKYEIGLSSFLIASGYDLKYAFVPSANAKLYALCHAIKLGMIELDVSREQDVRLDLRIAEHLNPAHFCWQELLDQFGIVKRELFARNPFRLDLASLFDVYGPRLEIVTASR